MPAYAIAVLPLAGIVVGAVLQFALSRNLEARKQLSLQRAEAYIAFFRAVAALAKANTAEQLVLAADAKTPICLYGSEKVVQRLSDFERAGAYAGTIVGRTTLMALLQAMRQDVASTGSFCASRI